MYRLWFDDFEFVGNDLAVSLSDLFDLIVILLN